MEEQTGKRRHPEAPFSHQNGSDSPHSLGYQGDDSTTDSRSGSPSSDYNSHPAHTVNMPKYTRSGWPNDRSSSDIRLPVHICPRAWSSMSRSKLGGSLNLAMKFPAVVVMVLGTLFLFYTYMTLPVARNLTFQSVRQELDQYGMKTFKEGGPRNKGEIIMRGENTQSAYHKGRDKNNGTWQPFGPNVGIEGYVYSAFYDDRVSLGTLPRIRMIVVAHEFEKIEMFCALTYVDGSKIEYVKLIPSDIGAGIFRNGKMFKEYLFSCDIRHEQVPESVGIVARKGEMPTFRLPIEIPARNERRENFGMCVSVTYWRHDPHQIVEWMEFLRLMGVSKVTIYNNSLEKEPADIFRHYDLQGFVDFRQSHNFIDASGELTIHMHMSPVINDCLYRNLYKYKKIIVADLDEMIVPRTTSNYYDMIVAIEQREIKGGNEHPAKHYLFRNNYFFLNTPDGEDTSQSPHLMTMRHRKKVAVSEHGYAIKSIIDPLSCKNMHNHYCWKSTTLYNNGYENIEVDPGLALNQHYKKCHLDVWEHPGMCNEVMANAQWDDNILRFKEPLEKAVSAQLKLLGLAPL